MIGTSTASAQSLGFKRTGTGQLQASHAIGTLGGLIGEVLAVAVATALGLNSRLMNVGEFIFSFRLTGGAFVSGLIAAATIGAIGGLLPAARAARIGVMDSLRSA